jgi:peptidoglycan/xylan/chitin deacetylase (PgdA/CDA1 family)
VTTGPAVTRSGGRLRARLGRLGRRGLRSVLGVVALSLVLSVFATGYQRHRTEGQIWPQSEPPAHRLTGSELGAWRAAATTPPGVAAAPIVLAYHDVVARPNDRYDVSRDEFARHMAMLHAAGYHTLSGEQFVDVLHGEPAPPRSVVLTFDDGTQGLWTYADQILARYEFRAIALVITGHLDDRAGPYYLSWPEVRRMAASGRWTFGSHTRDSHQEIPIGPAPSGSAGSGTTPTPGASGTTPTSLPHRSKLVNRRWSDAGRESFQDFRRRVDADLRGSIRDLTGHGLPRPRLFAYPFSEASLPGQDPEALRYVLDRVGGWFDAAFSSLSRSPEPVGARTLARTPLIVDRLAVDRATTAADLFEAMRRMRTLPVSRAAPLARDAVWLAPDGRPVPVTTEPVTTDGGRLTIGGTTGYLTARYAGQATADWTGYRVTTTVRGLLGAGNPTRPGHPVSATLLARVGSSHPVQVRVSARQVRVSLGPTAVVAKLDASDSHAIAIEVSAGRTVVTVDGVTRYDNSLALPDSPLTRGGIGVAGFRSGTATPFPVFTRLRVTPLGGRQP